MARIGVQDLSHCESRLTCYRCDGVTPLQLAIIGRRQVTAKFLVRRGADLNQKDDSGVSPLDVVIRSGDTRFQGDLELAAKLSPQ